MKKVILAGVVFSTLLMQGICPAQTSTGMFPLWKSLAQDKDMPSPFGFGVNVYYQDQLFTFKESKLIIPGFPVTGSIPNDVKVKNKITEINLKADLWIFPFLNIFGILGSIDGRTKVDYELMNEKIVIDYEGIVYGSGITLVGGVKNFFGTLTGTFSQTKLKESQSAAKALVVTPKLGITGQGLQMIKNWSFWIGAMYQQAEENHKGNITVSGEDIGELNVQYDVTLEQKNTWNPLAGFAFIFKNNLSLEVEGGIGDRKHAMASLIYRL